jgi:hypothetical protein
LEDTSAARWGWCAAIYGSDASLFEDYKCKKSTAGERSGAFYILSSASPVFSNVQIVNSGGANYGGGIAIFETAKSVFINVTISDFSAVLFGGGVYATDNTQSIFEKCEFLNNLTTGILADGGSAFSGLMQKGGLPSASFRIILP